MRWMVARAVDKVVKKVDGGREKLCCRGARWKKVRPWSFLGGERVEAKEDGGGA